MSTPHSAPAVYLNITTTAGCRGQCLYCPQDAFQFAMGKRPTLLSLEELTSLLPHLSDTRFKAVSFGGFSEPFDNPEIVALISLMSIQDFVDEIWIYTNGEALTPSIAKALADCPLARVDVSCHGFDSEVYRRTRSFIDPLVVRDNVIYLLAHRDNIANLTISVTGPFGSDEDHAELQRLCDAAGARLERRALHSRAGLLRIGQMESELRRGPFRCAKFDFEKPVLVPGGDLTLCCQDFALRHILGNLHQQTFHEIMSTSLARQHVLAVAAGLVDDPQLDCYKCAFCVRLPAPLVRPRETANHASQEAVVR
jgi:uncharacterized Fe-S cluster-containing radical SAM superfamily protein